MQEQERVLVGQPTQATCQHRLVNWCEAYACREALALAEHFVVNKVRIASDCLRVINNLKYCTIVQEMNDKKRNFQICELIHEYHTNNGEAHRLARMATTLDSGRHVWLIDPPYHLRIAFEF